MTEIFSGDPGIGRRIAKYRRLCGFETAKQLADSIPNDKLTASVIQNIESGRKADLSVSQLLDIARGIGISPLFLLTPVGLPFDRIDLAGVGDDVANMTVREFDDWLCVAGAEDVTESREAAVLRRILRWIRELIAAVEAEKVAATDPDLTAPAEIYTDAEGEEHIHRPSEGAVYALERLQARIDTLYGNLHRYNVDLNWVKRPWRADG